MTGLRAAFAFAFLAASLPAGAAVPVLGYDDARHLLNRTQFSASDAEIRRFAGMTRAEAADALLANSGTTAVTPPPAIVSEPLDRRRPNELTEQERKAYRREQFEKGVELRAWWYREMLDSRSPLTEKMTLFWHNHFVSSQQKVRFPQLMYRQNVLLRRHALGSFRTLLHEVAKDPAMLIYLDNANSRRGQPNENFAREAMELFTLGEGHYTEADVKEAARAFTGWSVAREDGSYRYRPFIHDYGRKTVLGRSGNLNGDDVLDILLEQPACAEFIVRKLWREFVSPDPDERDVKRIAILLRESGYNISTALRALLTSDAFYAAKNRATLVKSPVDLIVGTLRQFDIRFDDLRPLVLGGALLGQNLFSPPNVKGWPGGEAWINSSTLLARKQMLARLFRMDEGNTEALQRVADDMPATTPEIRYTRAMNRGLRSIAFDSQEWLAALPGKADERSKLLPRLLLATAPHEVPDPALELRATVAALVSDPVYQLK
jgi:uncharacterized protein (DUF1800 family)